jgi:ribosomal protein S18 acetylase RimI-like enzyme
MEKTIIVPARLADAVLLKNIDDVSFEKVFHKDMEYYINSFEQGNDHFLLLVDDLPIGEIILIKKEDTVLLESFAIVPKCRRRGLSKYMLDFIEDYVKGYKKIMLEVYVNNKKAIDIYSKQGYNITRDKRNFYLEGYDVYVMEKIL